MVDRQCPRWIGLAILRWPRGSARVTYQGQVAQLVEQRTENPCVGGSIPSLAINPFKTYNLSKPNSRLAFNE
jgi:hypothetical protein